MGIPVTCGGIVPLQWFPLKEGAMSLTRKFRFNQESPREEKTMKRLIGKFLVPLVVITGAYAFAPSASADTCTTASDGTTYCNTTVTSVAYGTVSTSTSSVASSDVAGKVNLRYETTRGYAYSTTCYKASSFARVPRGAHCWIAMSRGYVFQNSGRNRNGQRVYFMDHIGSGYSPVGSKFYWDARNRVWRKWNCGNFVKFSGSNSLPVNRVALVKTFSAVTVTVKATQTATESVMSTASCTSSGGSASATAKGSGTATGTATATAKAITQTQATNLATNQVKSTVQNTASAAAYAAAEVDMYSKTWVSCSSTSQSPPPPSQTPPSIVSMTQLNDVDAGATAPNVCATVSLPGSDTGTVTFSAQYGTFQSPSQWTVSGQQTVCSTYVAPTEVPPGGTDQWTVFVRDNTTVLSAQQASSPFKINSPPPPPA